MRTKSAPFWSMISGVFELKSYRDKSTMSTDQKTCTHCLVEKPLTEYYLNHSLVRKIGYLPKCKQCFKLATKARIPCPKSEVVKSKVCNVCCQEKDITYYYKSTRHADGYYSHCKECHAMKLQNTGNNPQVKRSPESMKEYWKNKSDNIQYRLKTNIRRDISTRVKRFSGNQNAKNQRTHEYLDCTIVFFVEWIESNFNDVMNWDNYAVHWELDHVKPCSSFDLSNDEEAKACFHWSNYQPLRKDLNRQKSDAILEEVIHDQMAKAQAFLVKKAKLMKSEQTF